MSFLPGMFPAAIVARGGVVIVYTDSVGDGTNQTGAYTFSGRALGTAAPDRRIVVEACGGSGFGETISTVSIAGIAATQVVTAGNGSERTDLWQAYVPTGTTGDIVVTWSGSNTKSSCAVGIWAVYGAKATAFDTVSDTDSNPATGSIDSPDGGGVIAALNHRANSATTYTWSGVGEDFDSVLETDSSFFSGASIETGEAATISISATASQAGVRSPVMVAASFSPAD